jgi:hypothetical protein
VAASLLYNSYSTHFRILPLMTSPEARAKLVEALQLDLVGPWPEHPFARELLPENPTRWYLTGYLGKAGRGLALGFGVGSISRTSLGLFGSLPHQPNESGGGTRKRGQ